MLEDVGSKMEFSWLSWAMFGHLGAKVGEQERKMQQMNENVGFLEAWGGGGDASTRNKSRVPPLKNIQRRGLEPHLEASASNLRKLRLKLSTDRVTQQVPMARWRIL